jgi:hypothetical protein
MPQIRRSPLVLLPGRERPILLHTEVRCPLTHGPVTPTQALCHQSARQQTSARQQAARVVPNSARALSPILLPPPISPQCRPSPCPHNAARPRPSWRGRPTRQVRHCPLSLLPAAPRRSAPRRSARARRDARTRWAGLPLCWRCSFWSRPPGRARTTCTRPAPPRGRPGATTARWHSISARRISIRSTPAHNASWPRCWPSNNSMPSLSRPTHAARHSATRRRRYG